MHDENERVFMSFTQRTHTVNLEKLRQCCRSGSPLLAPTSYLPVEFRCEWPVDRTRGDGTGFRLQLFTIAHVSIVDCCSAGNWSTSRHTPRVWHNVSLHRCFSLKVCADTCWLERAEGVIGCRRRSGGECTGWHIEGAMRGRRNITKSSWLGWWLPSTFILVFGLRIFGYRQR